MPRIILAVVEHLEGLGFECNIMGVLVGIRRRQGPLVFFRYDGKGQPAIINCNGLRTRRMPQGDQETDAAFALRIAGKVATVMLQANDRKRTRRASYGS